MKYVTAVLISMTFHVVAAQVPFDKRAKIASGNNMTIVSDRNKKENFTPVDGKELLSRLKQLSVTRWNYRNETPSVTHIGPTAQDFYKTFGVGNDEKVISPIDPAGISLAAIQELMRQLDELKSLVNYQQAAIGLLKAENSELKASLESRIKKLEAKLEK